MAKADFGRILVAGVYAPFGAMLVGHFLSPSLSPRMAVGLSHFGSYSVAGYWVLRQLPDMTSRVWRAAAGGAIAGVLAGIFSVVRP